MSTCVNSDTGEVSGGEFKYKLSHNHYPPYLVFLQCTHVHINIKVPSQNVDSQETNDGLIQLFHIFSWRWYSGQCVGIQTDRG